LGQIGLVKRREMGQQLAAFVQVLVGTQNRAAETAALHLTQLVNQHIAHGTNIALKAATASQHQGLAESATIGEFGKLQHNRLYALKSLLQGVCIIPQCQGVLVGKYCVFGV
jgi:hypothetical protein